MKKSYILILTILISAKGYSWGFYGHKLINYRAVFLLPTEMIGLYKPHIEFMTDHAIDPDKRRYAVEQEGPRHYIDLDTYGKQPIPKSWSKAVEKFSEDTLVAHGIVPWWILVTLKKLTNAFRAKDLNAILKLSAEAGHYVADAHVPLHTSANHNGQFTNQHGIHGFWESRIPELYAETEWDLLTEKAVYLRNPVEYVWSCVHESFAATDSVLGFERKLNDHFKGGQKYSFENRNGQLAKQYSTEYSLAYNSMLNGMIERRMRQSISAVASLWYTAWVNAGKPDLKQLAGTDLTVSATRW